MSGPSREVFWLDTITRQGSAGVEPEVCNAIATSRRRHPYVEPRTITRCGGDRVPSLPAHAACSHCGAGLRVFGVRAAMIPKKSFGVTSPAVFSEMTRISSGDGMRPAMKRVTVGCSQPINSANSR